MLMIRSPALTADSQRIGTVHSSLQGLAGGADVVSPLLGDDFVSSARYGRPVWVSRISRSALGWLTATVTSTLELDEDVPELLCENAPLPDWELDCPLALAVPTDSTCTLGSTRWV